MKTKFDLEELKREHIYKVPENYFDRLPNRIMQRVTATPPESSGAFGWLSRPVRMALAGSGFAAVFATVFMLNFQKNEPDFPNQLAQLNNTEIVNYLLATEQLERSDLSLLNATDQDLTYEFIAANPVEIQQELDEASLNELYY